MEDESAKEINIEKYSKVVGYSSTKGFAKLFM
jgi:hypothetical protein